MYIHTCIHTQTHTDTHIIGLGLVAEAGRNACGQDALSAGVLYVVGKTVSMCILSELIDFRLLRRWFVCGLVDGTWCSLHTLSHTHSLTHSLTHSHKTRTCTCTGSWMAPAAPYMSTMCTHTHTCIDTHTHTHTHTDTQLSRLVQLSAHGSEQLLSLSLSSLSLSLSLSLSHTQLPRLVQLSAHGSGQLQLALPSCVWSHSACPCHELCQV